jgi:undecaprenyl diphosphate synthase
MAKKENHKLHIAIIMDGNGRWAKARGLPRPAGHKAGIEAVQRTLKAAKELPVSHLTLYSFSSENWRRPMTEIQELMKLLRFYLRSELETIHKEDVRIKVIGDLERLPSDIAESIARAEAKTKDNKALTLTLALSYGGRQEIVAVARALAEKVQAGKIKPESVDDKTVESFLFTSGMPDPDFIIRTSGEQRLSNFLLWQSAYAEFVFLDVLWPDFSGEHLASAIAEFRQRERRYGDTVSRG